MTFTPIELLIAGGICWLVSAMALEFGARWTAIVWFVACVACTTVGFALA